MSASKVRIYGTRSCPYCVAARNFLKDKGITFADILVDNNPKLRTKIMQESGRRTVPQIWFGDHHVGGFDDLMKTFKSGKLQQLLSA